MKRILIVTSFITGSGHKSITNAITTVIDKRNNAEYRIVEGFKLGGVFGIFLAKIYIPFVLGISKYFWKFIYKYTQKNKKLTSAFIKMFIKKRFLKEVNSFKPDLIVTIHAIFNDSLMEILKKNNFNIPFAVVCADLVSISDMWCNKNADLIICPTQEAFDYMEKYGVSPDKMKIIKLPVRKEITDASRKITLKDKSEPSINGHHNFIIMSGSEGTDNFRRILNSLLLIPDSKIRIIAGNNKRIKKKIEKEYSAYSDRIEVFGYIQNVGEIMAKSDIAIVRASPNVLMECINFLLPIIVNGAVSGHEEGNVDFVISNGFGIKLENDNELLKAVNYFCDNNNENLIKSIQNEQNYRDELSPEKICDEFEKLYR